MSVSDVVASLRLRLIDEFSPTASKLQASVQNIDRSATAAGKNMTTSFGGISSAMRVAGAAIAGSIIVEFLKDCAAEAVEAEKAIRNLNSALRSTDQYTKAASDGLQAWAEGMRDATGFSDELVTNISAMGLRLGMSIEQTKLFARASLDLGAQFGSVEGAAQTLQAAYLGQTRGLKQFGIGIDAAAVQAGGFGIVLDKVGKLYGGKSLVDLESHTSQVRMLKEEYSSTKELIGGYVVPALSNFFSRINEVAKGFKNLRAALDSDVKTSSFMELARQLATIDGMIQTYKKSIMLPFSTGKQNSLKELEARYKAILIQMGTFTAAAKTADKSITELLDKPVKFGASVKSAIEALGPVIETWRSSFAKLKTAHDQALTAIEARTKAHADAMTKINAAMDVGKEALDSLGPEAREGEAWMKEKARLQGVYNKALMLEGDERVEALKDYISQRAKFTAGVTEEALAIEQQIGSIESYSTASVTASEAVAIAQRDILSAMDELSAERERQIEAEGRMATAQQDNAERLKTAMDAAQLNVKNYMAELAILQESLDQRRTLNVDASAAILAAEKVKATLDAIPNVQYKTVIIEYKTKASPIMPFSEGMAMVKKKMLDLPSSLEFVIAVKNVATAASVASAAKAPARASETPQWSIKGNEANWATPLRPGYTRLEDGSQLSPAALAIWRGGDKAPAASRSPSSGSGASLVVNIYSTGAVNAKALDADMAVRWKSRRSKLRQAMEAA